MIIPSRKASNLLHFTNEKSMITNDKWQWTVASCILFLQNLREKLPTTTLIAS